MSAPACKAQQGALNIRLTAGNLFIPLAVPERAGHGHTAQSSTAHLHELVLKELGIRQVPPPPALVQAAAVSWDELACE